MTLSQIQREFPHRCAGVWCAVCQWVTQKRLRPHA